MLLVHGPEYSKLVPVIRDVLRDDQWQLIDYRQAPMTPQRGSGLLVMGAEMYKAYQKAGVFPGNRGIESMREVVVRKRQDDGPTMVTYSPGAQWSDAKIKGLLRWDIRLIDRVIRTGSLLPELGQYVWITAEQLLQWAKDLVAYAVQAAKPTPLVLDLETMGFFPWIPGKKIVTVQLTAAEGQGCAVYMPELDEAGVAMVRAALELLLTCPAIRLRGANLKYDLMWLRVMWGLVSTNFTFDTVIVGSLLDENRSNGLSWHSKEHTSLGGYDIPLEQTYDKGKMELIPKADLLPYAVGDVDAAMRVSNVQIGQLMQQPGLMDFYAKLLHPAVRAFEDIEFEGVAVNVERYKDLERELLADRQEAAEKMMAMLSPRLKAKHAGNLKFTLPTVITDHLFDKDIGLGLTPLEFTSRVDKVTGERIPATGKVHLQQLREVSEEAREFIDLLQRWKSSEKMVGTYVYGFLDHLRPDGRFHPTYYLFNGETDDKDEEAGTVTGRLSAKNPAVQTIPKHKKPNQRDWPNLMRRCFPAPDGYEFFEADFSQGELRVIACLAPEPAMLQAYSEGKDLHCVMGSSSSGMTYDEFFAAYKRMDAKDKTLDPGVAAMVKMFRQRAKAQNFGLIYGMGATGFRIYARDSYGVKMTEEEAVAARETFFKTYPRLLDYHDNQRAFAREHLCVINPLGRVRHLPLIRSADRGVVSSAERMAINSPVQSCLSDMCLWSIHLINRRYRPTREVLIAGMTHDSIYGYILKERRRELAAAIVRTMSTLPLHELGWYPQLGFPADIQVGPSWGELETLNLDPAELAQAA